MQAHRQKPGKNVAAANLYSDPTRRKGRLASRTEALWERAAERLIGKESASNMRRRRIKNGDDVLRRGR